MHLELCFIELPRLDSLVVYKNQISSTNMKKGIHCICVLNYLFQKCARQMKAEGCLLFSSCFFQHDVAECERTANEKQNAFLRVRSCCHANRPCVLACSHFTYWKDNILMHRWNGSRHLTDNSMFVCLQIKSELNVGLQILYLLWNETFHLKKNIRKRNVSDVGYNNL